MAQKPLPWREIGAYTVRKLLELDGVGWAGVGVEWSMLGNFITEKPEGKATRAVGKAGGLEIKRLFEEEKGGSPPLPPSSGVQGR